MSTETPEKTPYQLRREAVARAIEAWQELLGSESGHEPEDAGDLEDCLMDAGLILQPRSTGHGKWRVLVDGKPAPYPGQDLLTGPIGAEEVAEVFLTQTAADEYGERQIVVRPATETEMVTSAVTGDTTVREEPFRLTAETYKSSRENATGRVELEIGGSGRRVVIDLGDDGDEILAGLLGFHERDDEDEFFDEDEDASGGVA
ncbi:hypothetical protein [Nonomuraea sp. NPDC049129]|uniref:hypothetical protein n=1 Tax=Nonomuraea sp. NPDC049129 TaxID=3155272 RepID=UPI00340A4817